MKSTELNIDSSLMQKAWSVRKENFPPVLYVHRPKQTLSVSVTGTNCSLNCAHCGKHYLQHMTALDDLLHREDFFANKKEGQDKSSSRINSLLVSGGCDAQGVVPFSRKVAEIKELREKYALKLNFHTGLVSENDADLIQSLADVVSFDLVGDEQSIERVYGLQKSVQDYWDSFLLLRERVRVVPHICIGLEGGRFRGEERVLQMLADLQVPEIVFLVFMPTKGTLFEAKSPPDLQSTVQFLAKARIQFPKSAISLGCMRPAGNYRKLLDLWALRSGVNRMVMPTSLALKEAEELGLDIELSQMCCVL